MLKSLRALLPALAVIAASVCPSPVAAAPFTPGNLVVYRVDGGGVALTNSATAVFLDEYTPAGVFVQSIAMPTAAAGSNLRLTASGTATTEGFLSRSEDGVYLVVPGYDAALGTASITTSTTIPRVMGRVDSNGTIDTSSSYIDAASSGNIRSVASVNGSRFWASGSTQGVRTVALGGSGAATIVSSTATNLRQIGIFGGQLYIGSGAGTIRMGTVGSGTPITAGNTMTALPGFPTVAPTAVNGYLFADLDAGVSGVDTLYVADEGNSVISKWCLVSGTWTARGTVALTTARGLTGTVSGSTVTLFATGGAAGTPIVTITDASGYNANLTGSVTTIVASAGANRAFRGIAMAPVGAALPNLTINDVSLSEGNAGTTSFTFTVSLSALAGPGGVTFDIATADGTAQDDNPVAEDNDYVANSLTAQTIPAGSSTYSFTVLGNGDTAPETNETFFVNVTNVIGATVTDGQGQGTIVNDDAAPNLTINDVSLNEGNAGTTTFTFTVSISAPAGPGGVTFDIATADGTAQDDNPITEDNDYVAQALTGQTIPAGSSTFAFNVVVNGDITPETDETFFVNVTNITNAIGTDSQGQGTIVNDDITRIHEVQGNGAATPIPGASVMVEGVVVGDYQASSQLSGFFLEEEDADFDADPATSEGIFIFCSGCPTAVAEGQRVRVTGTVSEFNNMTEITASTAGSVVITDAGNNLAQVTPSPIDLPIAGVVNDFYEAREGMLVTFVDTLTVSEYFELARYGQTILYEGGRPRQFTEASAPSVAGYTAHVDNLSRRKVILDDDNNRQNAFLSAFGGPADGSQFVFHPQANGGFSVGTQGTDFFRGGDLVNGLTGVLHWSFPGFGADTWRLRPTAASPVTFTATNLRPATPPAVGGAIKVAGMNLLNYFTTIDTTSSTSSGPCGPSATLDCRGADSVAELNRQRERASVVICGLNADIYGFMELENTTPSATITDLLGAVNARCGGAHPYDFVNTGGTLGTDAIRVQLIYRTGIVAPVGSPIVDLDPVHNRPPTAQTFDVVDAANPAFGERFTVIANHFKSKGCPGTGSDADLGDGQGCFNGTRTAQATRLLTWINSTVLPAAGDPDVLLVGDFNSYAQEDPVTTIEAGGYSDLETVFHGAAAYSYLFDGQLGHLDYAFASTSLGSQVTGADAWHINADEASLFDYNDEAFDSPGEANFEEKPDGSALVPPRVVFQPASPYRAADHDPVLVGLFQVADLSVTKTDFPDPVVAGNNLTYFITVTNDGPDAAVNASWSDTLPAGTTFVSMPAVAGWSCTTGATVSCSNPSFAVGSASFTLTVAVDPGVAAGTVLSNTATATSDTADLDGDDLSATTTTTVVSFADLSVTKTDSPDPVNPGGNITYTITVDNAAGSSNAATVSLSDTLPAETTFVSLSAPGGWSCTTPAVGAGGTVTCSIASLATGGNAVFTLTVAVDAGTLAGTVITNTATVSSASTDPNPGNESATATTDVEITSADLSVIKTASPDPVTPGSNLTYTITVTNNGPDSAAAVTLSDPLPAGTTFVSLSAPGGWSCSTPAVGAAGTVSCSIDPFAVGNAVFTLVVAVDPSFTGTEISNTAAASSPTPDPNPEDEVGVAITAVTVSADLSVAKVDTPDPVAAGSNLTYTITVTNNGPNYAADVALNDTLPAGTTFQSLSTPGGWICAVPAVGSAGAINCTNPSFAPGSAVFTLTVGVGSGVANGTVLTNTATVTSPTADPNPGNESASANTTVTNSTVITATKTASGQFIPGGAVTYTIVLTNTSGLAQADNPGNEFIDVLPAQLTLVSANATSGAAVATVATNTVTWNGAIAGGASVTITIQATVRPDVPSGTTVSNQGVVSYDANGDGTNETTIVTDSPAAGGPNDPTTFVVSGGGVDLTEIPTLSEVGLALLVLLLALGGTVLMRRRART